MARLFTSGFELNSATAGVEWDFVASSTTVSTAVVRSGTYAGNCNLAGAVRYFQKQFTATSGSGPYYFRTYFYVATLPSAETDLLWLQQSSGSFLHCASIYINTDGTLRLYNYNGSGVKAQVGSASAALSTGTWYRIELKFDKSPATGSQILEGKIDGTVFATASNLTISNAPGTLSVGGNGAGQTATGNFYYDDVAFNDSTGSFQNTYPGAGSVIHLRPNAAGDNSAFTVFPSGSNYSNVDDVTPDDASTFVLSTTNGAIDDYNIDATPGAVGASDTINVISVGLRFSAAGTTNPKPTFVARAKASSGGTVEEGSTLTASVTSWNTNAVAVPRVYPLTMYDLPGVSTTAWTKSDLDVAQIGVRLTDAPFASLEISAVWMLVDFTPVSGTTYFQTLTATGTATPTLSLVTAHLRTLTVSATATPLIARLSSYLRTLAISRTATVSLTRLGQFLRNLSATGSGTPTLLSPKTSSKAISATGSATATLTRLASFFRSLSATGTGTGTLTAVSLHLRTLAATATASVALTRLASYYRSLTATATGSVSLARLSSFFRSLSQSATATAGLSVNRLLARSLTATGSGTPSLVRIASYFRTLIVSATATPGLSRTTAFFRSLTASATATASLTAQRVALRTLTASASASATLTRTGLYVRNLAASAVASPTISRIPVFNRLLNPTTTTTPILLQGGTQISRSLNASPTAVVRLTKGLALRLAANASANPAIARHLALYRSLGATAAGTGVIRMAKSVSQLLMVSAMVSVILTIMLVRNVSLVVERIASPFLSLISSIVTLGGPMFHRQGNLFSRVTRLFHRNGQLYDHNEQPLSTPDDPMTGR